MSLIVTAPWRDYRLGRDVKITLLSELDTIEFIREEPQDYEKICGKCKHYCPAVNDGLNNHCSRTGRGEIGYFWERKCFTKK